MLIPPPLPGCHKVTAPPTCVPDMLIVPPQTQNHGPHDHGLKHLKSWAKTNLVSFLDYASYLSPWQKAGQHSVFWSKFLNTICPSLTFFLDGFCLWYHACNPVKNFWKDVLFKVLLSSFIQQMITECQALQKVLPKTWSWTQNEKVYHWRVCKPEVNTKPRT